MFRLKSGDIPEVDLAYSLGLFDYLEPAPARKIVATMSEVVGRGGRLVIGNLSNKAGNLGYCEAVMDWWMIPRTTVEMLELGEALIPHDGWKIELFSVECFNYLVADRMS